MRGKKIARCALSGLGGAVLLSAALAIPCFAEEGVTTMATTALAVTLHSEAAGVDAL